MRASWFLLNSESLEQLPAALLRARASRDARAIAQADALIRRKQDGRFLAVVRGGRITPLWRGALAATQAPDLEELARNAHARASLRPLQGLRMRLDRLGLHPGEYEARSGLVLVREPTRLSYAGRDRYRRPLWLTPAAAVAWRRMQSAARQHGIALDAISGYRSHAYQLGIFERKLARGLGIAQILAVNAAPGYSEHHGGDALDLGTPGDPPAEEGFERTSAFAWLQAHAGRHGFRMSYPRGNPHGIVYEPWHWRFVGAGIGDSGFGIRDSVERGSVEPGAGSG